MVQGVNISCILPHRLYNDYYSIISLARCGTNEIACNDGRCILKSRKCDGYKHCRDGSDEINCPPTQGKRPVHNTTLCKNVYMIASVRQ